jgi:tRNA threonylcarbamoyladenosine biosynthesis protein TsaE
MTTSGARELVLRGAAATTGLGRRLGRALLAEGLPVGGVLALSGHLGAGKTTLVKGLAEGLGVARGRDVTSPTFLRVVRYEGPLPLVHVDAYRFAGPGDVVELGLDLDLAGGACVAVEWAETVALALPADRLLVELDHVDEGTRRARLSAGGPSSAAWLARATAGGRA